MPPGDAAVPCAAGDKGQKHQAPCKQHYKGGREGPCKERNPLVLTPDWVSCMCLVCPVLISPMCGTWMGSGGTCMFSQMRLPQSSQILTSTPVILHLIHGLGCAVLEENEQSPLGAVGVLEHISKCLHSFIKRGEKYGIKSPADNGKTMQEGCDNFQRQQLAFLNSLKNCSHYTGSNLNISKALNGL